MRPMVAVVAAEEPETAAKSAQPSTLTCSRRPGSRAVKGARPENMSEDSRERTRISPIQMNIGSAVRSQTESPPQTLVAKTSSGGAGAARTMATSPTSDQREPHPEPGGQRAEEHRHEDRRERAISISAPPRCALGRVMGGRAAAAG